MTWQPIATAPKEPLTPLNEGPTILLAGGFIDHRGRKSVRTGYWKAARTNDWRDTAQHRRTPRSPTHWQPLPEPPEEGALHEWQPIATAVKGPGNFDGQGPTILLAGGFIDHRGRKSVRTGYWKAAHTNAWCDVGYGWRCPRSPTHWQPLPEPPEEGT